jgi:acetyl esterase
VLICGHDPLAREGRVYAERLAREGVRVTLLHLSDQTHGMITMTKAVRAATGIQDFVAASLRDAFRIAAEDSANTVRSASGKRSADYREAEPGNTRPATNTIR